MMFKRMMQALHIQAFAAAVEISRLRAIWPHEPSDFSQLDRDLDLLFNGASNLSSHDAVRRARALSEQGVRFRLADMLRWGELQALLESQGRGTGRTWQRSRDEVSFVPWLTRSIDVRRHQPVFEGMSMEALLHREIIKRAQRRRKFAAMSEPQELESLLPVRETHDVVRKDRVF